MCLSLFQNGRIYAACSTDVVYQTVMLHINTLAQYSRKGTYMYQEQILLQIALVSVFVGCITWRYANPTHGSELCRS